MKTQKSPYLTCKNFMFMISYIHYRIQKAFVNIFLKFAKLYDSFRIYELWKKRKLVSISLIILIFNVYLDDYLNCYIV